MGFQFRSDLSPEFQLALVPGAERWSVVCSGILDLENAAALVQPELLRLHAEVVKRGIPVVDVAVQSVEYMNSSGLKSFMAWFLTAANEPQGRYRIEVRFDPTRSWQQLSFRPMERLAPNTVTLVPNATAPAAAGPAVDPIERR